MREVPKGLSCKVSIHFVIFSESNKDKRDKRTFFRSTFSVATQNWMRNQFSVGVFGGGDY